MAPVKILGRAWIFDNGDPSIIECLEHELEPMVPGSRSGSDWCHEYLCECLTDTDLREMFSIPKEGNFQVIFSGTMDGAMSHGMDGDEYDEWFDLDESKYELIPEPRAERRAGPTIT